MFFAFLMPVRLRELYLFANNGEPSVKDGQLNSNLSNVHVHFNR